jgi:hypothetical protein
MGTKLDRIRAITAERKPRPSNQPPKPIPLEPIPPKPPAAEPSTEKPVRISRDKIPPFRLPHATRLEASFDTAAEQWQGTLTIPGGEVYEGTAGAANTLLARLGEQWWRRHNEGGEQ